MSRAEWEAARNEAVKAQEPARVTSAGVQAEGNSSSSTPSAQQAPSGQSGGDRQSFDKIAQIRQRYPRAYMPWTEIEDRRLLELFEDGATIPEIARGQVPPRGVTPDRRYGRQALASVTSLRRTPITAGAFSHRSWLSS